MVLVDTNIVFTLLVRSTPQNIALHLKAIYTEREQDEAATCKSCLQVRTKGER